MSRIYVGNEVRHPRRCRGCGQWFYPKRADAEACSTACRMLVSRAKCNDKRNSPDRPLVLKLRHPSPTDCYTRSPVATVELPEELAHLVREGGELHVVVVEPPKRTRKAGSA